MFYTNGLHDTRQMFFTSWTNYCNKKPLSPLEAQIVDVIIAHPEYHAFLSSFQTFTDTTASYASFPGGTSPFLHMGLHLALRDQIHTNRPQGITHIYKQLLDKHQNTLEAEHKMMDCLSACLWTAQNNQSPPNELDYLEQLKSLL